MTRPPLTFRVATDADVDTIAELGYHSFPIAAIPLEARRLRFAEDPRVRVSNYLVGETGGRVVASLHSIPFTTWVAGARLAMQGLASVTVAHEARRKGYASELVAESMRRARAAGTPLSALYPFRHGFYADLGYALAVDHKAWTFAPGDLPHYPERALVRRATNDDLAAIDACYLRVARRSSLMVERGTEDWLRRHFDLGKRFAVVFDDRSAVRGYFIYQYKEYADERHTRLQITEIVYEDPEALRGLLGHIAALRDQFLLAECVTASGERLDLRLRNPRARGAVKGAIDKLYGPRVLYGAMARILDVERALGSRVRLPNATGAVRLSVDDEQLPANRGPWDLSLGGKALSVSPASGDAADVRTDVATLTQLALGYVTATEARDAGLLAAEPDAAAFLDVLFAGPRPALADHF